VGGEGGCWSACQHILSQTFNCDGSSLLGCYAVSLDKWFSLFWITSAFWILSNTAVRATDFATFVVFGLCVGWRLSYWRLIYLQSKHGLLLQLVFEVISSYLCNIMTECCLWCDVIWVVLTQFSKDNICIFVTTNLAVLCDICCILVLYLLLLYVVVKYRISPEGVM